MRDYEFTKHAADMLIEREIPVEWIFDTIDFPDKTEFVNNEEIHYIKAISEFDNRYLRVVVNPFKQPKTIVTFFFDRRIKELL